MDPSTRKHQLPRPPPTPSRRGPVRKSMKAVPKRCFARANRSTWKDGERLRDRKWQSSQSWILLCRGVSALTHPPVTQCPNIGTHRRTLPDDDALTITQRIREVSTPEHIDA